MHGAESGLHDLKCGLGDPAGLLVVVLQWALVRWRKCEWRDAGRIFVEKVHGLEGCSGLVGLEGPWIQAHYGTYRWIRSTSTERKGRLLLAECLYRVMPTLTSW